MSTLSVACPYCQAKIKVPEKMLGQQIQCPKCKQGLKLEGAPPAGGDAFSFGGNAGGGAQAPAADFGRMASDDATSRSRGRPSAFWELLRFRRMIAPFVLQLVFWLAVLAWIGFGGLTVVFGVLAMAATSSVKVERPAKDGPFGKEDPFGKDDPFTTSGARSVGLYAGGTLIVTGLLQMIFGPLVTRVFFELLIMLFRVYDVLREIRDKLDRR